MRPCVENLVLLLVEESCIRIHTNHSTHTIESGVRFIQIQHFGIRMIRIPHIPAIELVQIRLHTH